VDTDAEVPEPLDVGRVGQAERGNASRLLLYSRPFTEPMALATNPYGL
jgi:hypothetical protein